MSLLNAIRKPLEGGPPNGTPDDADLAAINLHCNPPLTADDVFVFACVMCNAQPRRDQPWSFGLSSLKNFAADAQAGIPYLLQHDRWENWSAGYTYGGYYDEAAKETRVAVYLLRGFQVNDEFNSDQEITAIQKGTRREFSVGPSADWSQMVCSICGLSIRDENCPHLLGREYGGQTCVGTLEDAHAVEVSGVDRAAVPGCVALKAQAQLRSGQLAARDYEDWRDRFAPAAVSPAKLSSHVDPQAGHGRTADPTADGTTPAAAPPTERKTPMRDKLAAALLRLRKGHLAAACMEAKEDDAEALAAKLAGEVDAQVAAQLADDPLLKACAAAEIKTPAALAELQSDAAHGREYAAQLRADAKALAVKAFGQEEGVKLAAGIDAMPLAALKASMAGWEKAIPANLKPGNASARTSAPAIVAGAGNAAVGVDDEEDEVGDRFAAKTRARAGITANTNGKGGQ